jgi:hypothetical protein
MLWINLILLTSICLGNELPRLLTKHSADNLRFVSNDGEFIYIMKRSGVLGMVNNFNTYDVAIDQDGTNFLVSGSRFKNRLIIATVPRLNRELNVNKLHNISVVGRGKLQLTSVGEGITPKLHLNDEWISYYIPTQKKIVIQNVLTQKKHFIQLSSRVNLFFRPAVEMINDQTVLFTDLSEQNNITLQQYNLASKKSIIIYRSPQNATRMEVCSNKDYLAFGEFPFDQVQRSSQILFIQFSKTSNLAGYESLYKSENPDLGQMICLKDKIYFIKTRNFQKKINYKTTEVAKINLRNKSIEIISHLRNVSRLIEMDDRILIPFRGEYFVVEGEHNLGEDKLKEFPKEKETL